MEAGDKAAGRWGEAMAIAYYTRLGYQVYSSFGSHCPDDLVVIKDGVSLTVEARVITPTKNGTGDLYSWQANIKYSKADIILAVHPDQDTVWELPGVLLSHRKSMILGPTGERLRARTTAAKFDPDKYRVDGGIYGIHEPRKYRR